MTGGRGIGGLLGLAVGLAVVDSILHHTHLRRRKLKARLRRKK